MTGRARGALVWRLYAVGIVQLLLVIAGAVAIAMVLLHAPRWFDPQSVGARLTSLLAKPAQLERMLDELRGQHVRVSLYNADRQLLVTNVEPPLPVLDWTAGVWPHGHGLPDHRPGHPPDRDEWPDAESQPSLRGPGPHHGPLHMGPPLAYARVALPGGDGLLVMHLGPPKPSPLPPLLAFGFGLVVIFVGAFLTARWIGRPIEQLSRAARALGGGDLRTRTEIRRNDELGDLGRAFDDMAGRMEQLLLAEKELLANVAHELRTPLARIRVALEIAVEGDADAARASLAEIAVDLAELEALINDVLTAASFEFAAGRASEPGFALRREQIPARSLVERAAERFAAHHPQRPLTLECEDDVPDVDVDPALFHRVLDNLLENAHKYSSDASLPIRLRLGRNDAHAIFEVIDQGIGIAEEDLPRVFGAFFRGERSRSRGSGGVGLGLTLAKRIVDAHGGTIRIASSLGAGTSARVSLPLVERLVLTNL